MPLHRMPVTVPYTLVGDAQASLFTIQVDAVATSPTGAIATAQVLVEAMARMRHPGRGARVASERVRVGSLGSQVTGVYAYVLSNGFHIPQLDFPSRIDQDAAQQLEDTLSGLDQRNLYGVVIDCVYLQYISSMGIAALASNAKRARLRLLRPSASITKVLEMVGLTRLILSFPDLPKACDDLVADFLRTHAAGLGSPPGR
ncbi:MAG: STAS domain-containing protein [Planctomycetota bacterium]